MAVEDSIFLLAGEGKLDSLHAQNDIFHGGGIQGSLRMADMGIDNGKVVLLQGDGFLVCQKLPGAILYIKQLCKIVGMRQAFPVPFIAG